MAPSKENSDPNHADRFRPFYALVRAILAADEWNDEKLVLSLVNFFSFSFLIDGSHSADLGAGKDHQVAE